MNKHGNLKWQGGNKTGANRNPRVNGAQPADAERAKERKIPEADGNALQPEAEHDDEVDGNKL